MGEALAQAPCLRKLDVSNTGITSAGISGLAAALAFNNGGTADAASAPGTQLKDLKLAGNPGIGDAAVAELARSLAQPGVAPAPGAIAQPGLSLDLAMSAVGVEGIQALAQVPHLEQLSLFGCKLGQPGERKLCAVCWLALLGKASCSDAFALLVSGRSICFICLPC